MNQPNHGPSKQEAMVQRAMEKVEPEKCPVCGSTVFLAAYMLKKIPVVLSPNGKGGLAIGQSGWQCSMCQWNWNPEGIVGEGDGADAKQNNDN